MTQVKKDEALEKDLRAKTTANLRAGNREYAGQLALQLQATSARLQENSGQLNEAEKTYRELVKARDVSIQGAKKKIEDLKYAISDMEVKKATAEMTEMASGMISSIGGSGDTLNRLEEMVGEEREKAAGRARVARDSLNTTDFQMQESEQHALADQALADFAASEGLALEPAMPKDTGAAPKSGQARWGRRGKANWVDVTWQSFEQKRCPRCRCGFLCHSEWKATQSRAIEESYNLAAAKSAACWQFR